MQYEWLLFDADDTLFDYPKAEDSALRGALEHFGLVYQTDTLRLYQGINREVWSEFERGELTAEALRLKRFRRLFEEIQVQLDPVEFSQKYLDNLAQTSDLITGAKQILQILSGQYRLAIVTNGLSEVQRSRLERAGIMKFFEKIFISEELGTPKPEIGFFNEVFKKIDNPAKNKVLIIGDSLSSDMWGGIQYGIDTCWFNPGGEITELPVTYIIKTLGELKNIT
jgi:2-haloacid dehalogenase